MTLRPESFDFVRQLVHKEAAIVLDPGKEYLVEARLLPLAQSASTDVDAYVANLRRTPDRREIARVVAALTTNETSWMRDSEPFQALSSDVVPAIMSERKTADRTLNIWSAACSSGQEPYSIAMMVGDQVKSSGWRLNILATDINEDMLAKAQAGLYNQLEVNRGLPATLLVRHFTRVGAQWKINDDVRSLVQFKQTNLAQPLSPALPKFDVIFLRNVLIYFDAATKRAILQRMRQALQPDGYLFLGGAETTLGLDDSWERVKVGRGFANRPKPGAGGVAGSARLTGAVPGSRTEGSGATATGAQRGGGR